MHHLHIIFVFKIDAGFYCMQQIQGLNISPNMIQQLCEKMLDPTIT